MHTRVSRCQRREQVNLTGRAGQARAALGKAREGKQQAGQARAWTVLWAHPTGQEQCPEWQVHIFVPGVRVTRKVDQGPHLPEEEGWWWCCQLGAGQQEEEGTGGAASQAQSSRRRGGGARVDAAAVVMTHRGVARAVETPLDGRVVLEEVRRGWDGRRRPQGGWGMHSSSSSGGGGWSMHSSSGGGGWGMHSSGSGGGWGMYSSGSSGGGWGMHSSSSGGGGWGGGRRLFSFHGLDPWPPSRRTGRLVESISRALALCSARGDQGTRRHIQARSGGGSRSRGRGCQRPGLGGRSRSRGRGC